jgi:N-methylhydantoinase A
MLTRDRDRLHERFHAEHLQRYKQSAPGESMEIVSVRLVVTVAREDRIAERWLNEAWVAEEAVEETAREVVFDDPARPLKARILWRPSLPAGMVIAGPAIVEEPTATTLVHPGDVATVQRNGHLLIAVGGSTR